MFCKNCGAQIPDNSAFCNVCGASLASKKASEQVDTAIPQPVAAEPPKKKSAGKFVGIGLICAVVVAAAVTVTALILNNAQPAILPNNTSSIKPNNTFSQVESNTQNNNNQNIDSVASSVVPNITPSDSDKVTLTIEVEVEENKKLAKYDVDFAIGNTKLATISNGKSYTKVIELEKGSYEFVFSKNASGKTENEADGIGGSILNWGAGIVDNVVGKKEITATKTLDIQSSMRIEFTIHTNERSIEIYCQ